MTPPRAALVGIVAVAIVAVAGAQTRSASPQRFKSRVDLVTITATVVDAQGRYVSGLTREAFEVYEDGERQTLTHFSSDRVPIGLGMLLDVSDSMRGRRIAEARASVSRFLFELLSPDDEFFLMSFNHAPRVIAPWTSQPDQVLPRLEALRPSGGTSIYDAVLAALPLVEQRSRQRASIVIISDGADTASDASVRDVKAALLRSDAFAYAIAIDPPRCPADQQAGQSLHAARDHRRQRRPHRGRARQRGARCRDGAHRRRAQPPVRARVHVGARARRPVPQHSRAGHAPRPSRARAAGYVAWRW